MPEITEYLPGEGSTAEPEKYWPNGKLKTTEELAEAKPDGPPALPVGAGDGPFSTEVIPNGMARNLTAEEVAMLNEKFGLTPPA